MKSPIISSSKICFFPLTPIVGKQRRTQQTGLTMIETLITISILAIILAIGISPSRVFQRNQNISARVHEITALLERARLLASVKYSNTVAGVYFDTNQYVLFRGLTYNAADPFNETRQIVGFRFVNPQVFSNGQGGFVQYVLFNARTGMTVNTGTIRLESLSDPTLYRTITINSLGSIQVQ